MTQAGWVRCAVDITSCACSVSRTTAFSQQQVAPLQRHAQSSLAGSVRRHHGQIATRRHGPCRGLLQVSCVGWDPEGILSPPQPGHIARRNFQRKLQDEDEQKDVLERQVQAEREKRRAAREARIVPETQAELVEFFLETEAQEFDFEIARCRPRLKEEFFSHVKSEIGSLRFAVNRTQEMEDRLQELEALEKVLLEGTEAYDRMAADLMGVKDRLACILASKDKRATLLEMAGKNELDRRLLALLDENIAAASAANQEQAAKFMEKVRGAVVKYITI